LISLYRDYPSSCDRYNINVQFLKRLFKLHQSEKAALITKKSIWFTKSCKNCNRRRNDRVHNKIFGMKAVNFLLNILLKNYRHTEIISSIVFLFQNCSELHLCLTSLSLCLPFSPKLLADDTSKSGTHHTICSNTWIRSELESRLNRKFENVPPIYQVNKCVPLFTKEVGFRML
jgi:hypothetical protein